MVNNIIFTVVICLLTSCAFKESSTGKGGAQAQKPNKLTFIPKDLKIADGVQTLAAIDSIALPLGDYQIDQTVPIEGVLEYPYQYPSFQPTNCTGLGYTVFYETKRRGASGTLKFKIYLNETLVLLDHVVASAKDGRGRPTHPQPSKVNSWRKLGRIFWNL